MLVTAQAVSAAGEPSIVRAALTGADGSYVLDLLDAGGSYYVVSQPVIGPKVYAARASGAIAIAEATPVAGWDSAFDVTSQVGTLSGEISPAADESQADEVQVRQTLDAGGAPRTLVVRTAPGTVASGSETYSAPSLPAGAYTVLATRRTVDGEGNETVTVSGPVNASVPAAGAETANLRVPVEAVRQEVPAPMPRCGGTVTGSARPRRSGRRRWTVLEPDVTLTDIGLALECAIFAALLLRARGSPARRWFAAFFGVVGVAAALGAVEHGFVADKASSAATIVWTADAARRRSRSGGRLGRGGAARARRARRACGDDRDRGCVRRVHRGGGPRRPALRRGDRVLPSGGDLPPRGLPACGAPRG